MVCCAICSEPLIQRALTPALSQREREQEEQCGTEKRGTRIYDQ